MYLLDKGPKLLPLREHTLINKLVTCANIRLETNHDIAKFVYFLNMIRSKQSLEYKAY